MPKQPSRSRPGGTLAMTPAGERFPDSLNQELIAPCGMNCGLCIAHLRQRNRCAGCALDDPHKAKHCTACYIKNCAEMRGLERKYCYECAKFPCLRLRKLDLRYRTKYGMSMIANLEAIRALGMQGFVAEEKKRWRCARCGRVVCVHRAECIYCGHPWRSAAHAGAKTG